MNIALVTTACYPPCQEIGGIERYIQCLSTRLVEEGHNVHVICRANPNDRYNYDLINSDGVHIHKITEPIWTRKFPILKIIALRWLIRKQVLKLYGEFNVNVVEFANAQYGSLLCVAFPKDLSCCLRVHTPMQETLEVSDNKISWKHRILMFFEKIVVVRSKNLVTSTSFYARKVAVEYGIDANRFSVIPLGIPLPEKKELNIMPNNVRTKVLYVGRLEGRKGTDYLLDAIPIVIKKYPNIEFLLIGKDYFNQYQNKFWKENFTMVSKEQTKFLGFVTNDELRNAYRDCDVFVAPSLSESFGLIFIEAMSWAKPVVACDVCAVKEVVSDGESGTLVPPEDSNAIAEALINLIQSKDRRIELGKKGRGICEEKFSIKIFSKNMTEFYRHSIKG